MTDHEDVNDASLDARGRIEEALDGVLDRETLDVLLKEVLAVTKHARGWCPNCKKQVHVEIPDSKAVVSAMGELLTQAKGRPGPESSEDGQRVTVFFLAHPQQISTSQARKSRSGETAECPFANPLGGSPANRHSSPNRDGPCAILLRTRGLSRPSSHTWRPGLATNPERSQLCTT